jgi:putative ATP-binding cassette transporter
MIPNSTLISVGHRPELEAYHGRELVLEHRPGGARLIRDEYLTFAPGPAVAMIHRIFKWRRRGTEAVVKSETDAINSRAAVAGADKKAVSQN